MKDSAETLKALYKTLKATQKKLHEVETAGRAPIAIIGMACRFPGGADNPERFRSLLENGLDAIMEVPGERWDGPAYFDPDPQVPGKVYTNRAGFLREPIDGFDSAFFHLSPKEVQSMDPQQRMLLEVCWEAFENGGIDITALKGSRTGVFCGIANSDYSVGHLRSGDPKKIDGYSVTGTALSAAVGRISYMFGLEGPNMALDTACSSSLVAVHLACRSLRAGESDIALAAGVNLILTPEGHIGFSKLRALSPDGRCKSFDDAADGYGRGEGCGVVILKRLSDAGRDGDTVSAVIRGTAVNQDGRTNGFTAPSGLAQEKVLRAALEDSGLRPDEINYIEAHGTGTPLGDPIEMEAIGKVYASGREPANILYAGSVKANIGHLEAAAGIAGIIKAALVLQDRKIMPQIHFSRPSRHIPWEKLPVRIPLEMTPLPENISQAAAAVSSFGFSGTNAHAILQEAPPANAERMCGPERQEHILNLSANDPRALQDVALRYREYLADTGAEIADICHTASACRPHFPCRLSVIASSKEQMLLGLEADINGTKSGIVLSGEDTGKRDKRLVFMFTGQGSQYHKMGWDLYETQPVFRAAMDRCDDILRTHMDHSLISLLYGGDGSDTILHQTRYAQPAIFSVEYSVARLLESWGVRPSLVLGHSIGEYVAACVAGIFELEEVLGLVAARGRLVQTLPGNVSMAVIVADEQRAAGAIRSHAEKVSIAAVNSPRNTVISGEQEAVAAVLARLRIEGVASHPLNVSHAFHSCLLDPLLGEFRKLAASVSYEPPKLAIMSNITGRPGGPEMATPDYWTRHMREPVRFYDSMREIAKEGYEIFIEVGGTSTLTSLGMQCMPGHKGLWLPTLGSRDFSANLRPGRTEGRSDWVQLLQCLAGLYTSGVKIDWKEFDRPYQRKRVVLPNYPFQRKKCWVDLAFSGERENTRGLSCDAVEAAVSTTGAANGMEADIVSRQLQLMKRQIIVLNEQLAALRGTGKEPPQVLLDQLELLDRQASLIRDLHKDAKEELTI